MKTFIRLLAFLGWSLAASAQTSGPDSAKGLWMTAERDAVIRFAPCADAPTALCGTIVWDKDAGTPADTCGVGEVLDAHLLALGEHEVLYARLLREATVAALRCLSTATSAISRS